MRPGDFIAILDRAQRLANADGVDLLKAKDDVMDRYIDTATHQLGVEAALRQGEGSSE